MFLKNSKKEIKRGEIYSCDLQPIKGHEKDGTSRPVLIVQNDIGNKFSPTTIGITLTSEFAEKDKKYPTNVFVEKDQVNSLDEDSLIETNQIRILDVDKRIGNKIGQLSQTDMLKVENALKVSLSLIDKCPKCNFMLFEKIEKCSRCNLTLYCRCDCDNLLDMTWKFCPYCGKEVGKWKKLI